MDVVTYALLSKKIEQGGGGGGSAGFKLNEIEFSQQEKENLFGNNDSLGLREGDERIELLKNSDAIKITNLTNEDGTFNNADKDIICIKEVQNFSQEGDSETLTYDYISFFAIISGDTANFFTLMFEPVIEGNDQNNPYLTGNYNLSTYIFPIANANNISQFEYRYNHNVFLFASDDSQAFSFNVQTYQGSDFSQITSPSSSYIADQCVANVLYRLGFNSNLHRCTATGTIKDPTTHELLGIIYGVYAMIKNNTYMLRILVSDNTGVAHEIDAEVDQIQDYSFYVR